MSTPSLTPRGNWLQQLVARFTGRDEPEAPAAPSRFTQVVEKTDAEREAARREAQPKRPEVPEKAGSSRVAAARRCCLTDRGTNRYTDPFPRCDANGTIRLGRWTGCRRPAAVARRTVGASNRALKQGYV